jgi:hypothetical protein
VGGDDCSPLQGSAAVTVTTCKQPGELVYVEYVATGCVEWFPLRACNRIAAILEDDAMSTVEATRPCHGSSSAAATPDVPSRHHPQAKGKNPQKALVP